MLVIPVRVALAPVGAELLSSYDPAGRTGGPRDHLVPLSQRTSGRMVLEAVGGLTALNHAVAASGGDFRVTDCFRDVPTQTALRAKYDKWVQAGKPPPTINGRPNPAYASKTMKTAFVALPGKSGHNGGRSIDIDVGSLHFPIPADRQLDVFWEIAEPHGWRPVIPKPIESQSEAWHFDYMGELEPIYDRCGYEAWGTCAALDVGQGFDVTARPWERIVQLNLHRAGYDVGEIDGFLGPRTVRGLVAARIVGSPQAPTSDHFVEQLFGLPTSKVTLAKV